MQTDLHLLQMFERRDFSLNLRQSELAQSTHCQKRDREKEKRVRIELLNGLHSVAEFRREL